MVENLIPEKKEQVHQVFIHFSLLKIVLFQLFFLF